MDHLTLVPGEGTAKAASVSRRGGGAVGRAGWSDHRASKRNTGCKAWQRVRSGSSLDESGVRCGEARRA
eukprot:363089-Chlamydomonas_euryale.AAC.1